MAKSTHPSISPKPPPTDGRGNQIHNVFLMGHSANDCGELLSKLE